MDMTEQLIHYAHYHRDPRNIATHLLGIPLIVLALSTLLSQPAWVVGDVVLSPAWVISTLVAGFYYFPMGPMVGVGMSLLLGLSNVVGQHLASTSPSHWLGWGLGLLAWGWLLQWLGHRFEGRKPAFMDDVRGLLQGPLFVVCEVGFRLGKLKDLEAAITEAAGPVRLNPHRN